MPTCKFCAEQINGSSTTCPHCGSQLSHPSKILLKTAISKKNIKYVVAFVAIISTAILLTCLVQSLFTDRIEEQFHFPLTLIERSKDCLIGDEYCYTEVNGGQWKMERKTMGSENYVGIPPRDDILISPREGEWAVVSEKGREYTVIESEKDVVPCRKGFICYTSAVVIDGTLVSVNLSYSTGTKNPDHVSDMTDATVKLEKENWNNLPNLGHVAGTNVPQEKVLNAYRFTANTRVTFNDQELYGSGKHIVHNISGNGKSLRETCVNLYWIKRTPDTESLFKKYEKIVTDREKDGPSSGNKEDQINSNVTEVEPVDLKPVGAKKPTPEPTPEEKPTEPVPLTMPTIPGIPDIISETPSTADLNQAKTYNKKGMALYKVRNYHEAIGHFIFALGGNPAAHKIRFNLGCTYALNGDTEKSLDILQQFRVLACPKCLERLEKAKVDSDFDAIRNNPRYKRIVEGE